MELTLHGLTIFSFVLMCWVVHRTLLPRAQCVNSSFVSFVQIGSTRIDNCLYESRLSLNSWLHPVPAETMRLVRRLEVLEPLTALFPETRPRVAVEVRQDELRMFEIGRGFIRLGQEWLKEPLQTQRALIMGLLKRDQPQNYSEPFQLEVMTDFLLMSVLSEYNWQDHSVRDDIKFSTSAPAFVNYCKSPFRSLAHYESCALERPDSVDLQANVWGLRPLLAVALWRVFDQATVAEKFKAMQAIRFGHPLPPIAALHESSLAKTVTWMHDTLDEQLRALHFQSTEDAIRRAFKELEIEAPTHWELTVDLTNTPAWKEILKQFTTWSRIRHGERTLVFTPEGAVALPSGLPVAWETSEIQSQKHILIACEWPKPEETILITARHFFARQSCAKVDEVFWN